MFNMTMSNSNGSIRLNGDGLAIRQGDTYGYLTPQEYVWLPVHHERGQELTITSEGGMVTILPHVTDALVSLIKNIPSES